MAAAEDDIIEPVFKEMPPGPGLALLLDAQEHDQLDDFDIIELARSARRLASWAAALELGAIAELSARRKVPGERLGAWDSEVGEWVTDEVAAALTLSGGTAARQVVVAEQLVEQLPRTYRALIDGLIDVDKAKVIADGVRGNDPAIADMVEERVLPTAPSQTCAELRYAVRKAIRDADPDAHEQRRKDAEEARRLELWETDAGTGDLVGRDLPAAAASAAFNRVNAIAQALKADGDPRTIDQLRADVYIALLRSERPSAPEPEPPAVPAVVHTECSHGAPAGRRSAEVADGRTADAFNGGRGGVTHLRAEGDVVVSGYVIAPGDGDTVHDERAVAAAIAAALRGRLAELTDGLGREGRRLGGQAALVREVARRIKNSIADLQRRWCVTGGPGIHGAGSYRVPTEMRRKLQIRDGTCRFPGCRRRAGKCDADHTEAYHKGGPTCLCNLSSLCRRHHRLKQQPEWQLIQIWPGVLLWIAPSGHWYITGPNVN